MTPVDLTRELLRINTVNPPGNERECTRRLGALLEEAGFQVAYHEYADRRTSLVARLGGDDQSAPLCLTGHVDTVALGALPWTRDAFDGETDGDRMYGRGVSDMKAGVASMVLAAIDLAPQLSRQRSGPGITLVLTAAEEGGCVGSRELLGSGLLESAGALLVGEPTANGPYVGHKGALKVWAEFSGVTAHGSMPQLGDNAVYKAARAALELQAFDFGVPAHPVMGLPTLNVGVLEGGMNINSVPDRARLGVDIRTVPGQDHCAICARLAGAFGRDATMTVTQDAEPVYTDASDAWVARVFDIVAQFEHRRPEPRTLTYYTDAGNLRKAYRDPPTLILGPGEPEQAHQTDEYCSMARIDQSQAIYHAVIRDWCHL